MVHLLSPEGHKLFQTGTYKLEDDLFDCNPDGLYQFPKSLSARAEEFGWTGDDEYLMIPKDPVNNLLGDSESLIEHYRTITVERIRLFENTYIKKNCRPA